MEIWLVLLPLGILGISIAMGLIGDPPDKKKVLLMGREKYLVERELGRTFIWNTNHPTIGLRRDRWRACWELYDGNEEYNTWPTGGQKLDFYPPCSVRKACRLLSIYLFDRFLAGAALNDDRLLEKYIKKKREGRR